MSGVVVSGYASLDHVVMLDGDVTPGRTTTILSRPERAWPRLGGSPAYVAQAIRASGNVAVTPISWIGADPMGEVYLGQLAEGGIDCDGIERIAGARTPIAVLAYNPAGDCACLYHPGLPPGLGLTERQRKRVRDADWICITIGPKAVTDEVLELISPGQKLAWVVKNDPRAITPEQTARLAARADLIFCNGRERAFLEGARGAWHAPRAGQTIMETKGRGGVACSRDGISHFVAGQPIDVTDPTGAGDTFAGGVIAAVIAGETELEVIGQAGNAAALALLIQRRSEDN
jgi:ribokinase